MPSLITLVNDNHVDNYLKEILAFVYYGLIVINQPKNFCHFYLKVMEVKNCSRVYGDQTLVQTAIDVQSVYILIIAL